MCSCWCRRPPRALLLAEAAEPVAAARPSLPPLPPLVPQLFAGVTTAAVSPAVSGGGADASMDFSHVAEPALGEVANYVRQRRAVLQLFASPADARAELLRPVAADLCAADLYPHGHALCADPTYLSFVRDLLNLSVVLDDMEQTGVVPYAARGAYYNAYARVHRQLAAYAKTANSGGGGGGGGGG